METLPEKGSPHWEYRRTLARLTPPIERLRREHGAACRPGAVRLTHLSGEDASTFVERRINYLVSWIDLAAPLVLEQLSDAWGRGGAEGDAGEIDAACSDYADALRVLVDWEKEVAAAYDPKDIWTPVFRKMQGSTRGWFEELAALPDFLTRTLTDTTAPTQKVFNPRLTSPPMLNAAFREMVDDAQKRSAPFWQRRPITTGAIAGALFGLWNM
ncbi:MAG: hypothetical protein JJT96_06015 [Opitutales bacterium]|nr:hypothetical protein [Opitutales bacterium]